MVLHQQPNVASPWQRRCAQPAIGQQLATEILRQHADGGRFTVADAHLAWALLLLRPAGVDVANWPSLADYLARMRDRPQVKAAIETETALYKTLAAGA